MFLHFPSLRFLFYGAGSAGTGIANLLVYSMMTASEGALSLEEANQRIYLVDSQGLVTKGRQGLNAEKLPYAHEHANIKDLAEIVASVKPTCLFGVAAIPQVFTQQVCEAMAANSTRPLIFALSNPTSKAECTAEQAYQWTNGRCLFASGSPFDKGSCAVSRTHCWHSLLAVPVHVLLLILPFLPRSV